MNFNIFLDKKMLEKYSSIGYTKMENKDWNTLQNGSIDFTKSMTSLGIKIVHYEASMR